MGFRASKRLTLRLCFVLPLVFPWRRIWPGTLGHERWPERHRGIRGPGTRLDVVMTVAILWNLQHQGAVTHRVVIAGDAILVNTEDVPQIFGEGHEGAPLTLGRNGPAGRPPRETGWPPPLR